MKTTLTIPIQPQVGKNKVNKFLLKGICFLTSRKFTIFVSAIASGMVYFGTILENNQLLVDGALAYLASFGAWSLREVARDMRQNKLDIKNW